MCHTHTHLFRLRLILLLATINTPRRTFGHDSICACPPPLHAFPGCDHSRTLHRGHDGCKTRKREGEGQNREGRVVVGGRGMYHMVSFKAHYQVCIHLHTGCAGGQVKQEWMINVQSFEYIPTHSSYISIYSSYISTHCSSISTYPSHISTTRTHTCTPPRCSWNKISHSEGGVRGVLLVCLVAFRKPAS